MQRSLNEIGKSQLIAPFSDSTENVSTKRIADLEARLVTVERLLCNALQDLHIFKIQVERGMISENKE